MKQKCFFPLLLICSCCADRVNEEYQGEKGPKDRRGNQALPDWISLVLWYVFHFSISLILSWAARADKETQLCSQGRAGRIWEFSLLQ